MSNAKSKKSTRSDKKFLVKLWLGAQRKSAFRQTCIQYHLSMMFTGEKFVVNALRDLGDTKIYEICDENLTHYSHMKTSNKDYQVLGIRLTNEWWQKLGYFAVHYDTSIAKIASCIFEYASTCYELKEVYKEHGTYIPRKRKKGVDRQTFEDRVSDYTK